MLEDLHKADPFNVTQQMIKKVVKNKRIITHAVEDLKHLGITPYDEKMLNVEHIDTAYLFNRNGDEEPMDLAKLADFF